MFVFQSEISTYSLILFSKVQNFYWIKELSKSNQTRYGVSHVYLECKTKRVFGIAFLGKKFVFQSEISTYSLILFSKIQNFYWIKELSKSNQTRYGVSHVYLECKTKRVFGIACLGKKFVFQSEISTYSLILFSKIQKFYRTKELSISNQTRYGVFHVYLECKTKRIFGIACLEKKFVFQSEISSYSLIIQIFYFQKYRNFIGSRSCPNRTKLGMEYPMCSQSVKQKEFLVRLSRKKVRVSIGNIDLFAYYKIILFSKIQKFYWVKEFSKSTQTRYGVSHVYLERKTKRIFGIACLGKKFVFQSEISTYSLILFSKIQKFYGIKEMSKSNQTRYGVSHVQLECKTKRIFGIAYLRKKFVFQSEISTYSLILFSKIQKFYRVKELSKSNQTRYGVSHVQLECKRKRIFGIDCLEKKFVFQS